MHIKIQTVQEHASTHLSGWRCWLTIIMVYFAQCAYQPLELKAPIAMYYQFGDMNLDYPLTRQTKEDVLFCFTKSDISYKSTVEKDGSKASRCYLNDQSTTYSCVRLFNEGISYFQFETLTLSIDQSNVWTTSSMYVKRLSSANPLGQSNTALNVSLLSESLTQTLVFTGYFEPKSIYHMFTCPIVNKATKDCSTLWKQNYVHTFKSPEKKANLIVQRVHNCAIFEQFGQTITTHVFYGGTIRNGNNQMFVAVLTHMSNENDILSMWGGFSYSSNHAGRDLFCFATDGSAFDGVSLIAGPVYKDVASNIGGTDDAEIVDNYYSERYKRYWMHFIQYHRPYETVNQVGDDRIFKKIYAEFAYAAFFDYVVQGQKYMPTPSCLSSSYKHNLLIYFPNDASLSGTQLIFSLIHAIVILILTY